MTYLSEDAFIAAMKKSAEETSKRIRYLDSLDDGVAKNVGGHIVPTGVMADIISEVARVFGVSEMGILGASKIASISTARQAVYYYAHKNGYTDSAIGRALKRDHSTVYYGRKKYEDRRSANA